jgi:hypothetical protein
MVTTPEGDMTMQHMSWEEYERLRKEIESNSQAAAPQNSDSPA